MTEEKYPEYPSQPPPPADPDADPETKGETDISDGTPGTGEHDAPSD